jgi:hypothetical protein
MKTMGIIVVAFATTAAVGLLAATMTATCL